MKLNSTVRVINGTQYIGSNHHSAMGYVTNPSPRFSSTAVRIFYHKDPHYIDKELFFATKGLEYVELLPLEKAIYAQD